jgi:hypothetical protein
VNDPARSEARREVRYPPFPSGALPEDDRLPAASRSVELAAELLDVVNETELEHFVRKLVSKTTRGAGVSLPPGTAHTLAEVLTRTARRTLPTLSPVTGSEAGSERSTAETAARVFGLELEGMSAEDRDFEIARQLIRFAEAAVLRTARTPDPGSRAAAVAAGVTRAGQELAPGLLPPGPEMSPAPGTGPWTRRGNDVEVIGVEPPWR